MQTDEARRIEATNTERYQLAGAYGWQFQPNAPELLERWSVKPFSERGDKRLAFGVLTGAFQGVPFTVFDFHRRPTVTTVHTRWTNKQVNELETITIDSVWVVTLPGPMPFFQIVSSVDSAFTSEQYPEPPTADRKFNRWYKVVDTDPGVAVQVLTPQVMAVMRQLKLHNWSLVGNELVLVQHPTFGRTKPDDVLEVLGKIVSLLGVLPMHLGAPQPQYQTPPQYGNPQPVYDSAAYPPQSYPQPHPHQGPYGPPNGYPPPAPWGR